MVDARETAQLLLETIPNLMRGIGGAARQHKSDEDALTMGQMRMLGILSHAPRNLGELANLHQVTPSTMSRTVDVLVRRDWVARQSDPSDRRQVILTLTAEGRDVHAATQRRLHEALAQLIARLIEQLDEGERERLYDGLVVMRKMLALAPHDHFDCAAEQRGAKRESEKAQSGEQENTTTFEGSKARTLQE
jgi:DNA-binding MarR family transcriptional regulator